MSRNLGFSMAKPERDKYKFLTYVELKNIGFLINSTRHISAIKFGHSETAFQCLEKLFLLLR